MSVGRASLNVGVANVSVGSLLSVGRAGICVRVADVNDAESVPNQNSTS